MYLLILTLFLHPSPPSQWLLRAPLVIMLPQVMQGFPLPYGCNNNVGIQFEKCHFETNSKICLKLFMLPAGTKFYMFNEGMN